MASIRCCLVSVLFAISQLYHGMEAKMTSYKVSSLASQEKHEVHIVYLGGVGETTTTNDANVHIQMLSQAVGSVQGAVDSILYSYKNSFNGFAAVVTEDHVETLRGMAGVVSVFKSQTYEHQTTESWEFLGLSSTEGLWPQTNFGNSTIIGMIDSGIWPESESFNGSGFGPIPSRWKGSCMTAEEFSPENCNNKLIGAKFYLKGYEAQNGPIVAPEIKSPRDSNGHGTHTSSIATGRRVTNASFDGLANGTAFGGAPLARLATYKACWVGNCTDADVLAAFEDAISDGVDLLSLSIAGHIGADYLNDGIAIGAFHAVEKGIVVSCAASNHGSQQATVSNVAPWIFTVAAGTINRVFQSTVELAGGPSVPGIAINAHRLNSTYPFVYAGSIPAPNASISDAASCSPGSLDNEKARGKIIVCQESSPEQFIIELGGVGLVSITNADQTLQLARSMPDTNVNSMGGDAILHFINSTRNPSGTILPSVSVFNSIPAPIIASFSSVGPPKNKTDFMKPDITGPGVNILGAWSTVSPPYSDFITMSGTSMATPHVTGTAALVKSVHPDWSPAAIKSAIMTTAKPLNTSIPGNYELASGAGLINPTKAVDPGLVFNTTMTDYVNFMCSVGYNSAEVQLVTGRNDDKCPTSPPPVLDLNYPSIFVSSDLTVGRTHNITRTVTNVGAATGQYVVYVTAPVNVDIQVVPSSLQFTSINEELSFIVVFTIQQSISSYNFGSITWKDDLHDHSVRMVVGVGHPA